MFYHPITYRVGARDVIAAWLVSLIVAVATVACVSAPESCHREVGAPALPSRQLAASGPAICSNTTPGIAPRHG
jgi:hypothetical protein